MPPLPNSNSYPSNTAPPFGVGAGYPPQQSHAQSTGGYPHSAPYPHQPMSNNSQSYPNAPYPNINPNPAYPMHQHQHAPNQPQAPFGAGFGFPNHQAYPQQSYPPSLPSSTGYPPAPIYPNASVLPSQGYSGNAGFQQPSSIPSAGYSGGAVTSNMANCFAEMQGHIKDLRKIKVCWLRARDFYFMPMRC